MVRETIQRIQEHQRSAEQSGDRRSLKILKNNALEEEKSLLNKDK
jgi:hypothetical protein